MKLDLPQRFIVILALALGVCACESFDPTGLLKGVSKPTVESIAPRITGIDLQGVNLAFDVGVRNPYGVPIRAPKFNYQLAVAEQPLVSKSEVANVNLPAQGVGKIELPVRVPYADAFRVARNLREAKEIPYSLKGNLLLPAMGQEFSVPLQKNGMLPVLRMPKFSDFQLARPQVSGTNAAVALDLAVENPNAFALGLEKLGYLLKLGDIDVGRVQASALKALAPGEKGNVRLTGTVSGMDAISKIMSGAQLGAVKLTPAGSIDTPWGPVPLR